MFLDRQVGYQKLYSPNIGSYSFQDLWVILWKYRTVKRARSLSGWSLLPLETTGIAEILKLVDLVESQKFLEAREEQVPDRRHSQTSLEEREGKDHLMKSDGKHSWSLKTGRWIEMKGLFFFFSRTCFPKDRKASRTCWIISHELCTSVL